MTVPVDYTGGLSTSKELQKKVSLPSSLPLPYRGVKTSAVRGGFDLQPWKKPGLA